MERWKGQVAVVTGASAGIGSAIADQLVENGLKVVGLARRKERLDELEEKLAGKPGTFIGRKVDITVEKEILDAFEWIDESVGPVSILINNAGLGRKTTIIDGDISEWRRVLDTNIMGLAIASREALKSMRKHDIHGHIVNINSIAGHLVPHVPCQNLYPASKHAVTAFTQTLRHELLDANSKVKVSSLSPGYVSTEILSANGFLESEDIVNLIEEMPALKSEDVANACIYILGTPPHVQVAELIIKPLGELF